MGSHPLAEGNRKPYALAHYPRSKLALDMQAI